MEYEYRRTRKNNTGDKKIGSFTARFTACAVILCICAAADYAGIGARHTAGLASLLSYNTDISPVTARLEGIFSKKELKAPLSGTITAEFGGEHAGIDIAADENTPVLAAGGGTVLEAGENGSYGNCVQIEHSDKSVTLYAHLSSVSVSKGDAVEQGTEIGKVGSTGDSTGPHLHFEVIRDGKNLNPKSVTDGL